MSRAKVTKQKGGSKKHKRNFRTKDAAISLYAKGKISFERYTELVGKGQRYAV